ncbi:MAG: hypothetical protein LBL90_07495 [Prevotellaceae bacterium]|jgi:hypothetical protein|nr:hypothetical protein [Prevotellaceae bacterium]
MNLNNYDIVELADNEAKLTNGGSWLSEALGFVWGSFEAFCAWAVSAREAYPGALPANYESFYYGGACGGRYSIL